MPTIIRKRNGDWLEVYEDITVLHFPNDPFCDEVTLVHW